MRINKISIRGLFGIFDHVISLNIDEKITIIHGPNGFGKTAILRMINGFFNADYVELQSIPFTEFQINFDDNSHINIIKNEQGLHRNSIDKITCKRYQDNQEKDSVILHLRKKISAEIMWKLERRVPGLERISPNHWLYMPTDEILSLEEVIERFEDVLPSNLRVDSKPEPEWIKELRNNIQIHFIKSQRLLNFSPSSRIDITPSSRINITNLSTQETVSAYSDELAKVMQDKFKEYGTISQSLDRTYPVRVVKQQPLAELTDHQLREQLDELENTRWRLIEVGLLEKDENSDFQIQPQDIDESTKNALSVYVEDVEKKLNVFDDIAKKIDLLGNIINQKFDYSYKKINFSKDKGFIFTTNYPSSSPNKKTLSPGDLSSGEQHELVLLYELLFKVKPNSLVLIDEPELSLHVGWQVEFLKDLQEITKLAQLDILMATHSPDIIQDRWDLTVELKRPES